MSDFNIRDFRGAGQEPEDDTAKSSKAFGIAVVAIPVFAAIAGFAYKPIMDMRTGNAKIIAMAEASVADTKERADQARDITKIMIGQAKAAQAAKEAVAEFPRNPKTGLIDLSQRPSSKPKKAPRKPLSVREYMLVVDGKEADFTSDEIRETKYRRTKFALSICGYQPLQKMYVKNNEAKYKNSVEARQSENIEAISLMGQQNEELKKIKTKGDALKFVASGGAARHNQAAMKAFSGMAGVIGTTEKSKVQSNSIKHTEKQCMQIRTMAQSGELNI